MLDLRNVLLGLAVCFLARVLGLLYYMNVIDHEPLTQRMRKSLLLNTIPFLVFFLAFVISIMLSKGYAVDPDSGIVSLIQYKYFLNLLDMPVVLAIFLLGVVGVLTGIALPLLKSSRKGIWYAGAGTVLTVLSLLLTVGYNNTAYYPSSTHLQSSLTIFNSSSSKFTLTAMSIVSLLIPIVLAYIWYAWRSMDRKKITEQEFQGNVQDSGEAY